MVCRAGLLILAVAFILRPQTPQTYGIGATLLQPSDSCPAFVDQVIPQAPADAAGIKAGDVVLTINGEDATTLKAAAIAGFIRASGANLLKFTVRRQGTVQNITVQPQPSAAVREQQASALAKRGQKIVSGLIVPATTTDAEVQNMLNFNGKRVVERIFPLHYCEDEGLYSAAFEIYILRSPDAMAVGGIEEGTAYRAGMHWGDILLSVNGTDLSGKTAAEIRSLVTSPTPRVMTLKVNRLGAAKEIVFPLEKTGDILRANHRRIVSNTVVPDSLDDQVIRCLSTARR